jgi:hypothetical protein
MPAPTKLVRFRGQQRSVQEIAGILKLPAMTVYSRLHYGRELDAPKSLSWRRREHEETPMCDDTVRYEQDVECRVARVACGGSCTAEELAVLWNTSHQRITQIEQRALRKLRRMAVFHGDATATLEVINALRDQQAARIDGMNEGLLEVRRSA